MCLLISQPMYLTDITPLIMSFYSDILCIMEIVIVS